MNNIPKIKNITANVPDNVEVKETPITDPVMLTLEFTIKNILTPKNNTPNNLSIFVNNIIFRLNILIYKFLFLLNNVFCWN
jgi:hypothetical protein|tara:strand:- start:12799 stop:13041 length:243 start_codon:yes stop_codon:yes gene_type:complete